MRAQGSGACVRTYSTSPVPPSGERYGFVQTCEPGTVRQDRCEGSATTWPCTWLPQSVGLPEWASFLARVDCGCWGG